MRKRSGRRLLALALCLPILAACCAGCADSGKEEAKLACEEFFASYAGGEESGLAIEGFGASEPLEGLQLQMAERLEFEVRDASGSGDAMQVSAVVTSVDLRQVLESLPDTVDSTEAAREALSAALADENVPTRSFDVDVTLVRQDDGWTVQMTPSLADALLGGYYSILREAAEEVQE